MNIGIDIDNVISNFNDVLLEEFIKHDKELRNAGIVNTSKYINSGMFDWSAKETTELYNSNIERITTGLSLVRNVKKYIDKLKRDGNKIIIITGRDNGEYSNPYQMTKDWLSRQNIYYDKLILTNAYKHYEKADICLEENIDIMIDDSTRVCEECLNKNIKCILFGTPYNKQETRFNRIDNWEDIYNYINSKINIILDTDTNNECDDLFALAYLLKSKEMFNIEAVTIAPYSHKNDTNIKYNNELSYKACEDIFKLCNEDSSNKIFIGSNDYIKNDYIEETPAIKKMIEIINKNDMTYILGIGAITNIAILLKLYPNIKDKIKVVWLGGHSLDTENNLEFNFKQDVDAVKYVYNSNVDLTVIPCKKVAEELNISIDELKLNMDVNKDLDKYLIDKFYNDGYHAIQTKRVIWDISVIAYMINFNWFDIKGISCPNINDDLSYSYTENKNKIKFVIKLNSIEIYKDLFEKLRY